MKHYLIRHGQSQFNAGETDGYDSNLTEKGSVQIIEAALSMKDLLGRDLDEVLAEAAKYQGFVSPLIRCLLTAMPLHKRWGINFIVDPLISETPDECKNSRYKPIPNRKKDFPEYQWPDFETWNPDRTTPEYLKELEQFVSKLPKQSVIVSHMTTIKDLAAIMVKVPYKSFHKQEVGNASITLIEDGQMTFMGIR